MSFTQALSTFRRVLVARWMPSLIASSKPCSEEALNSITRATGIEILLPLMSFPRRLYPEAGGVNSRKLWIVTGLRPFRGAGSGQTVVLNLGAGDTSSYLHSIFLGPICCAMMRAEASEG